MAIFNTVNIVLLITVLFVIGLFTYLDSRQVMCDMPKFDTNLVGIYDDKVGVSLYHWCLGVLVTCYKACPSEDIRSLLLDWNKTCNKDDSHILLDAVEKAYTDMVKEIVAANDEKRKPTFKVSSEFNYHVLPKTLKHNDYVDMPVIIKYIDEILEVYNG